MSAHFWCLLHGDEHFIVGGGSERRLLFTLPSFLLPLIPSGTPTGNADVSISGEDRRDSDLNWAGAGTTNETLSLKLWIWSPLQQKATQTSAMGERTGALWSPGWGSIVESYWLKTPDVSVSICVTSIISAPPPESSAAFYCILMPVVGEGGGGVKCGCAAAPRLLRLKWRVGCRETSFCLRYFPKSPRAPFACQKIRCSKIRRLIIKENFVSGFHTAEGALD